MTKNPRPINRAAVNAATVRLRTAEDPGESRNWPEVFRELARREAERPTLKPQWEPMRFAVTP